MRFLSEIIKKQPFFTDVRAGIEKGMLPAVVNGVSTIHKAHLTAELCRETGKKALYIANSENESARIASDLKAMGLRVCLYPVRDLSFFAIEGRSHEYEHNRIDTLCTIISGGADVVVTVPDAAMQFVAPPEQLARHAVTLRPGSEVSIDNIVSALTAGNYERTSCVEGPGQYSVRGGIIDFFPPGTENPVRVEMWGDEIDTISAFDVISQRRYESIDEIKLYPVAEVIIDDPAVLADRICETARGLRDKNAVKAREKLHKEADAIRSGIRTVCADKYIPILFERETTIFDYFADDDLIFVSEHSTVRERAKGYDERMAEEIKSLLLDGVLCKGLDHFTLSEAELHHRFARAIYLDTFAHGNFATPIKTLTSTEAKQLPAWDSTVELLEEDLRPLIDNNASVVLLAGTEKASDALAKDLEDDGFPAVRIDNPSQLMQGKIIVSSGVLSAGFEYPVGNFALITWGRGISAQRRQSRAVKQRRSQSINSIADLEVNDYVVHATHGIGIYGGVESVEVEGIIRDYIRITYARNRAVLVPVTQLDLVSKYIGAKEGGVVKLSSLGTDSWVKQKSRVRSAVKDIAKELIKIYRDRMNAEGYQFDADTEYQRDFEARFEYEETEDQLRCISEIKKDMERAVPMDRLLCGDVGFGKTEVALRAAFKCMVEGRQCALLAPTTILAWQHYQTALRRFDGFPFRIEHLSRFRTPKQQAEILKAVKKGQVDLLIGTHRIIQKDVEFRDLGLAIIDEEQRFGVAHKERFKQAFSSVDQLTLSATPIPRTLNMALSGLRDISTLDVAPQDRFPVQTYVLEYNQEIIADAIRRELRRGGQVYYLHNRVGDIEAKAEQLREMIPDAVVGVAHGQMSEHEISREWKKMMEHETDILLCTTIIESGVDVSNANTLIIENADCFGLSQLHQLRGRVGRSTRRAYAYLTFQKNKVLTPIAIKRLETIREFTEFGSGVKIAMRDLEFRGAGNMLGGEQSGHLDMVGYDLYMKMLTEAVAEEKGEKVVCRTKAECSVSLPIEAYIPEKYIEATHLRLDVYRLIADIRTKEDASDVIDELVDRFGDPPKSVMGLIHVVTARNMAVSLGICDIKFRQGNLIFTLTNPGEERVKELTAALKGKMISIGDSRSYISVQVDKKVSMIDNVLGILRMLEEAGLTIETKDTADEQPE